MPISRPAVSRHLRLLKDAGMVAEEAQGTRRIYHLREQGMHAIQAYLERIWGEAAARFRPTPRVRVRGRRLWAERRWFRSAIQPVTVAIRMSRGGARTGAICSAVPSSSFLARYAMAAPTRIWARAAGTWGPVESQFRSVPAAARRASPGSPVPRATEIRKIVMRSGGNDHGESVIWVSGSAAAV